jgi:hypothetical protein
MRLWAHLYISSLYAKNARWLLLNLSQIITEAIIDEYSGTVHFNQ